MSLWIANAVIDCLLCVFFAGIVIPQILLIALRKNLYDEPDPRKIHTSKVPRLGGIAFKPVFLFSTALLLGIELLIGYDEIVDFFAKDALELIFGFCGLMVLYLVGMADDLIGVRYRAKFFVQIACAAMLIAGGLSFTDFHGTLGLHQLPDWIAHPFTVLVIVFIINAINLIDGIDGLASGLCSVAFFIYGIIFYILGEYLYGMLSFAALGVLLPFFYYNVFGKAEDGKKIFMGDTGSLTIGFMICMTSLKLYHCVPTTGPQPSNPIIVAFAPLVIPCFDVIRVYFHRVIRKKNPFLPDKNHIHHKLLAVGMRQNHAMICILAVSLILTLCNIYLSVYVNINWLLIANAILWIGFNMWLTKQIKKKQAVNNK